MATGAAAKGAPPKAGPGGPGGTGRPPTDPPTPTPADDEGTGPHRMLVGIGIAAGVVLIVGLIVVLLQTGGNDGRDGDAIETGGPVTLAETTTTSERTTTTRKPTTTTTRRPTTTTTDDSPDTTGPAVTTTQPGPPTTRPTPTTQAPTPAELAVTCGGCSGDRMTLAQEGARSAIIINNVGGSPGNYGVTASGAVSVVGNASGVVQPGAVATITVEAGAPSGDAPHGQLTVSGPSGVIVTIDVFIG